MYRYPLIAYLSLFSPIIPICASILKMRTLQRDMIILSFYMVFALTSDVFLMWFAKGYKFQIGLYHFYYLIEYIFIMSILVIWQESHMMKRIFQASILSYMIFWIIAKLTFEPLDGLYSYIASASQILLIIGAETTIYSVIGKQLQPITKDYHFWVLISFIFYYAGTLLTIASRGLIIHYSIEALTLVGSIDWSLKILFNILFAIGFLCPQTRT
jgi:hypothetical protein